MANAAIPTQDAIVDPDATAKVAAIYGQNGPQGPSLQPPAFLQNALNTISSYGQGPPSGQGPAFNPRAIPEGQGFAAPTGLLQAGANAWDAVSGAARQIPGVAGVSDALTAPGHDEPAYPGAPPGQVNRVGQGPLSFLGDNPAALGPGSAILDPFAGASQALAGARAIGSATKAVGGSVAEELASQAAKVPGAERGFLAGEAGGARIPGGEPSNLSLQFKGGADKWAVVDPSGTVVDGGYATRNSAQTALAGRTNTVASLSQQINVASGLDPNAVALQNAAKAAPADLNDAVRRLIRDPEAPLDAATLAGTEKVVPVLNNLLTANGVAASDATRLALSQELIDQQSVRNAASAAKGNIPIQPDTALVRDAAAAGPDGAAALARAQEAATSPITGTGENLTGKSTLLASADVRPSARPFTLRDKSDVVNQILYNGVIEGTTQLLHSFGSISSSLLSFPEAVLDSGADALLRKAGITVDRNFTVHASLASLKAQATTAMGMAHDLPDAMVALSHVTDADTPSSVGKALLAGEFGNAPILKAIGATTQALSAGNIPLNVIAAIDNRFIRSLAAGELTRVSQMEALRQGLTGPAADAFAKNYFKTAGDQVIADAVNTARQQINRQAPGAIAGGILKMKNAPIIGPLGSVILPFFNTSLNILKASTTWSPLGFARLLPADLPLNLGYFGKNTVTEAARVKAVTRAGIGTLMIYPLWQHVLADNITGDGPGDPQQKAIWTGDPANPSHIARALRTPMGWVTYGKIPVFGDYLAAIADTAQAVRDNKDKDVSGAQAAVSGLVNFFAVQENALITAGQTIGAIAGAAANPNDKQAQAALAQELSNRGFELTPYSGAIRVGATIADPRYESATGGQSGLARLRADYAANFPAGVAPGVATALGGKPGDVGPAGQRTPGVTGGLGALLPVRVSGQTVGPISGQAAGVPPLASAESTRLTEKVPGFTPLGLPAQKIGPPDDQIKLSGSDYVSFAGYIGDARNSAVQTLTIGSAYQSATPDVQARMFKSAIAAADKSAEATYLKNGVLKGVDPSQATQNVILGLAATPTARAKADYLALIDRAGKLSSSMQSAIDASRTPPLPGKAADPTVSEYLHAAPLVSSYLSIKPYLIGSAADWAKAASARAQMTSFVRDHPAPLGMPALDWFQQANPQAGAIVRQFSYPSIVNPERSRYLQAHPEIKRFVSGQ